MAKANPSVTPMWVECTVCGQWVHDTCMEIDARKIKDDDVFMCGCDKLVDGKLKLQR